MTQIAYSCCYLETILLFRLRSDRKRSRVWFRDFDFKAFVAAPAERVYCAELHQTAMVTTEHFPLFY